MIARLILVAVMAGALAGMVATTVQTLRLVPLILEAEAYEQAEAGERSGSEHLGAEDLLPTTGLKRFLFTTLSNTLTGVAFGLLLSAAMVLRGTPVDWRSGALWGLAGFAAFSLAPSLGLPPELPGSRAAELGSRQFWWLGTAAATAVGLAVIVFSRRPLLAILGGLLLLIPHLWGAPHPEGIGGSAPPELAASFAVLSLAGAAAFWLLLGTTIGLLLGRGDHRQFRRT